MTGGGQGRNFVPKLGEVGTGFSFKKGYEPTKAAKLCGFLSKYAAVKDAQISIWVRQIKL